MDTQSGLYAESAQDFIPTYTGEFKKGAMQLKVGNTDYIYNTFIEDMDGDGKPDIVARHNPGFSVFVNATTPGGDITEESFVRSTYNGQATPGAVALVDFDGNGLKDVIGTYSGMLRHIPQLIRARFHLLLTPVDITTNVLSNLMFEDFDGDGRADIAGTTSKSGTYYFDTQKSKP